MGRESVGSGQQKRRLSWDTCAKGVPGEPVDFQYVGAGQRGALNLCQLHNGPLIHPGEATAVQHEGSGLGQGQCCPPPPSLLQTLGENIGSRAPLQPTSRGQSQVRIPPHWHRTAMVRKRMPSTANGSTGASGHQELGGRCHLKGSGVDVRMEVISGNPVLPIAASVFSSYRLFNLCIFQIYLFYVNGCSICHAYAPCVCST